MPSSRESAYLLRSSSASNQCLRIDASSESPLGPTPTSQSLTVVGPVTLNDLGCPSETVAGEAVTFVLEIGEGSLPARSWRRVRRPAAFMKFSVGTRAASVLRQHGTTFPATHAPIAWEEAPAPGGSDVYSSPGKKQLLECLPSHLRLLNRERIQQQPLHGKGKSGAH